MILAWLQVYAGDVGCGPRADKNNELRCVPSGSTVYYLDPTCSSGSRVARKGDAGVASVVDACNARTLHSVTNEQIPAGISLYYTFGTGCGEAGRETTTANPFFKVGEPADLTIYPRMK
jgi:hypothetical protein